MFAVTDKVAIATHLRSSACGCSLPVLCYVADSPHSLHKCIRTSDIGISTTTAVVFFSNIRWTAARRNQRGHEQVKDQLKPMNVTQVCTRILRHCYYVVE